MLRALETLGEVHRAMSATSSSSLGPASDEGSSRSPYFTPPRSRVSPYFTPPRTRSSTKDGIITQSGISRRSRGPMKRVARSSPVDTAVSTVQSSSRAETSSTPRRSKRAKRVDLPPTPGSTGQSSIALLVNDQASGLGTPRKRRRKVVEVVIPVPPSPVSPTPRKKAPKRRKAETIIAKSETGVVEPMEKIWLIQERVRHDPWKLLVATTLLNVTSGRAARPVYIEILRRWPTPQALAEAVMQDLIDVLYPIGLFIQRANSLKTLSRQYLDWAWPIIPSSSPCNPYEDLPPTLPLFVPPSLPEVLDVNAFRGAGRYASDSFRIYSHLLPGSGGPHQESRWVDKRSRALERYRATRPGVNGESMLEVETVGGYLSDEEDVGVEEWRTVRPTDKELRRYLIWRWGIEGIVYDIVKGPKIKRERDRRRLRWLIEEAQ